MNVLMVMPAASRMFDAVSIASSVVPNIFCCDAKVSITASSPQFSLSQQHRLRLHPGCSRCSV